jgi:ABC-type nitrate/sulfonate/bicarbonate transport system substrate-binding protein
MVPVGGDASRVQQLRGKQIDGTMINPPLSIMMRQEGFNLLLQAGDYVDVPLTGLGTTTKKLKEQPEQAKNVLRALYEGLRFVRTNRKETVEIFSRWLKMEPAIAAETYDLALKMLSPDGLMSNESILAAIEVFSDNPKELENVSLNNAVEFSLLRAVIKEYEK